MQGKPTTRLIYFSDTLVSDLLCNALVRLKTQNTLCTVYSVHCRLLVYDVQRSRHDHNTLVMSVCTRYTDECATSLKTRAIVTSKVNSGIVTEVNYENRHKK